MRSKGPRSPQGGRLSGRAIWRRDPRDPRRALGWALADAERVFHSVGEGIGCLGAIGAAVLFFQGHPLVAVVVFFVSHAFPRLQRRPRSVEPILTLPLSAPTFPCTVEVRREGTTIGLDRGVVTFVEGWLHFEGYRTTFSFSRKDVRKRDYNALTFTDGSGVEFHPDETLRAPGIDRRERQIAFSGELDRMVRLEKAAEGHSVLPPLVPHPSGVARARIDLFAALAKSLLILGAALYAINVYHMSGWFLCFVFSGGIGDAALSLRKLRRFAHESRRALPNDPSALSPP